MGERAHGGQKHVEGIVERGGACLIVYGGREGLVPAVGVAVEDNMEMCQVGGLKARDQCGLWNARISHVELRVPGGATALTIIAPQVGSSSLSVVPGSTGARTRLSV